MILYRVQDKNGRGPYAGKKGDWCVCNHDWSSKHPSPREEGLLDYDDYKFPKDWYCGFRSIRQLIDWFAPEELENLIKMGYKIVAVKAENFRIGKRQVVYHIDSVVSFEDEVA